MRYRSIRCWKPFVALLALQALWPLPALAQTVFFDDFNGNALLPHWNQPPATYWNYNVSNSMLNVTGLFNPSHPKSPSNFAGMGAFFAPQSDFQMDVWIRWDAGAPPHRLEVRVIGGPGGGSIIANMGYRNEFFGDPVIFASASNQALFMPAPDPGIYQFTISRTAAQFNFFLNGSPFASFHDNFGTPAAAVRFEFLGPYPGSLGAFHIDRVVVVPAPGVLALFLAFPLLSAHRRRH